MTFKRVFASVFFVIFASLVVPAMAQRGPIAAPTGAPATAQELGAPDAAPTTNVDIGGLAQIGGGGGFSIVESFLRAGIIVKTVMVLLLLASLWSWAIIINKWIALSGLQRKAARFEKIFWSGQSLDELYQQFAARNDHPMAAMFVAALREWHGDCPPRACRGDAPQHRLLGHEVERAPLVVGAPPAPVGNATREVVQFGRQRHRGES